MRQKEVINSSLFYMWRAVITIAHADGIVHEAEKAYLAKIFDNLDRVYILTAEQKSALQNDLSRPQSLADMMRHINDPAFRANVIYFGGLLARADGVLHPSEDAILKKLHADQMAGLDMDQIRKDVHAAVADEAFRHDLAIQDIRPQSGLSAMLDAVLLRLGIDLMD